MSGNINYVVASQQAQAALLKRIADTLANHAARLARIEAKLDAIEATLASIAAKLP
jgi:ABC-type transporter Mla subunit MlaD